MIDPLINARQPCPVFRGRTQELSDLQQQVKKLPAGIFAITGAPGAGKTTLLDEFLVRIGAIGDFEVPDSDLPSVPQEPHPVTHIRLQPELFANPKLVARVVQELVREHDPWYVKFGRGAGNLLGLIGDHISVAATIGDIDVHLAALQSFREAPLDTLVEPYDLLLALGNALPTGYLISIDEVQRLDTSAGRDYAVAMLQFLADNPARSNRIFGNSWVILAGLANTVDMLRRFKITRIDAVFSLGSLSEGEAREVLLERVGSNRLNGMSAAARQKIVEKWIPQLAMEYRHWPHHLEGVAVALSHIAREMSITDHAFAEVQRIADKHRTRLYSYLYGAVQDLPFRAWPAAIALANYANRHDNLIPRSVCEDCVAIAIDSREPHQQMEAIRQLCHAGLIQAYDDFAGAPNITAYRIPVPSFCSWLIKQGELDDKYRNLVYGNDRSP